MCIRDRSPVGGIIHGLFQGLSNGARCHLIGLAHAEIEHFHVRMGFTRGAFGAFDFFKFIDGRAFPELGAADTFRK